MSEYQYYEFCKINNPISREARKEMASLSSRAHISTHGASYVYNYGDFRGDPKQLLLKYFDVFFYISNFGSIRLIFRYSDQQVDIFELKKFSVKYVITCEMYSNNILLDVCINNEDGGRWVKGEGLLPDLLPLYEEIKNKDYSFLNLVLALNKKASGSDKKFNLITKDVSSLSIAQQAFLSCIAID